MFLFQSASQSSTVQSISSKAVQGFKQIFMTPELTEEERWDLFFDYSAVTSR